MNKDAFEQYLTNLYPQQLDLILEAESYSLLAGGKRIRPLMLFAVLSGNNVDCEKGYNAACAIEMVHTYSLIHDDLPAMDNDDYRRSRLTNHKVFGEDIAILAGDALLTKAFLLLSQEDKASDLVRELALSSGDEGMILGQVMDMQLEKKEHCNVEEINLLNALKTGKLLSCALAMGAIIANQETNIDTYREIGTNLGIAFQIQDDLLDLTQSSIELGKSTSDIQNNKSTIVSILGEIKATEMMKMYYDKAMEEILHLHLANDELLNIVKKLVNRKK